MTAIPTMAATAPVPAVSSVTVATFSASSAVSTPATWRTTAAAAIAASSSRPTCAAVSQMRAGWPATGERTAVTATYAAAA
jgi:hypothetical protein